MTDQPTGVSSEEVAAEPTQGVPTEPYNSTQDAADAIEDLGIVDEYVPRNDRDPIQQLEQEEREGTPDEDEEEVVEVQAGDEGDEPSDEYSQEYEDESTDPLYTITLDGKAQGVTLEELKNGYQKGSDYTRKTQDLSSERKSFEAEQVALKNERSYYAQMLQQHQAQLAQDYNEKNNIDWASLKDEDPIAYMTKKEELRDMQGRDQRIQYERQQLHQRQTAEDAENLDRLIGHEVELLEAAIPEMADEAKSSGYGLALKDYAMTQGYERQEIDEVRDHRALVILDKARKYDAMEKKATKKITKASKTVRAGHKAQPRDVQTGRYKQKMSKLKQTGNIEDAASVIYDALGF